MCKATTVSIILLPEVIEVPQGLVGSEKLVPERKARPLGFCLHDRCHRDHVAAARSLKLLAHIWIVFSYNVLFHNL